MKDNYYGYKICYTEKSKKQDIKRHYIVKNYYQAKDMKKLFTQFNNFTSHEDNHILYKPTWYIYPIKKRERKVWKERPF